MEIIGTLLGVIIGGSVAFFSNYILEKKKQKYQDLKLKKEKLEELYFLFELWEKNFTNIYLMKLRYFKGKIDQKTYFDLINDSKYNGDDFNKFSTLLNLYFSETIIYINNLDHKREQLSSFLFIEKQIEDEEIKKFIKIQEEFKKEATNFKNKIIELSKTIN